MERLALSTVLKKETNLKDVVGQTEYALGRKSAIEDLKKDIDAAIEKYRRTRKGSRLPTGLLLRL